MKKKNWDDTEEFLFILPNRAAEKSCNLASKVPVPNPSHRLEVTKSEVSVASARFLTPSMF